MLTTVVYSDSTSAAQTDTDCPLVNDPSVSILNSHPIFPVPLWIMWVLALGLTVTRVRISTPRLKPIVRPVVAPVDQSATVTDGFRALEYFRHPVMLNPVEEVQMLRTNTTAVAERDVIVLTVGDGNFNIPQGELYVSRGTTSYTPTVTTWSAGAITLDDTLQVGRYSIAGLRVVSANTPAARLIFPGAPVAGALPQIRPGVPGCGSDTFQGYPWTRFGTLGEYGQFESFAVPQLEVYQTTATANPEVFFDLINVRIGARAQ